MEKPSKKFKYYYRATPYNLAEQVRENTCEICRIAKYTKILEGQIIEIQKEINDIVIDINTTVVEVSDPTTESFSGNATTQQEVNMEVVNELNELQEEIDNIIVGETETEKIPVTSPSTESISGEAINQRIINEEVVEAIKALEAEDIRLQGEIDNISTSSDTVSTTVTDPITESISGVATNQQIVNQEVVQELNNLQEEIDNIVVGESETEKITVTSPSTESISGTATNQRIINEEVVTEIGKIENGEIDFPSLTLNGVTIDTWPEGGSSNSSDITDDSDTNPTDGINPWKIEIEQNATDIENIINGNTPIPQNTDNVIFTITGENTTLALGNFLVADPRLYEGSTNDTVVRDNILLSMVDYLQNQIDSCCSGEIDGDTDELLPFTEPPINEDVTINSDYTDYELLFVGLKLSNDHRSEELLNGKDLILNNPYFTGYNGTSQSGASEMYLTPTSTTTFTPTYINSNFTGTSYIEGLKVPLTPLLNAEGSFNDEVHLNQDTASFDYFLFKSSDPDRVIYKISKNYNARVLKCDGDYNNRLTVFGYFDDPEDNYFTINAPSSTNNINMIWGFNFDDITELKDQSFNPTDYDIITITYDFGIHYITSTFITKNIVYGTVYKLTSWAEGDVVTFSGTGYSTNEDIMSVQGIKLANTPILCKDKINLKKSNKLKTNKIKNNLAPQHFNTFSLLSTKETEIYNEKNIPILKEVINLDKNILNFVSNSIIKTKKSGKMKIEFLINNLINLDNDEQKLTLNIYLNNKIYQKIPSNIPYNYNGLKIIKTVLELKENDEIYFEWETEGYLKFNMETNYNIEFSNTENILKNGGI